MKDKKIIMIFAIMCFILSFCIVLQIRIIKSANSPVLQVIADNELRNEVLKWKEKYDATLKQLEKSEKEIDKVRKNAVENDSEAAAMQEEIINNNDALGLTDVTGPGIIITIESTNIDNKIKEDLDFIINELKNAGAESFELNGERLISSSVITCEESVIKVNGITIQSPFIIQAIGDSKVIYGAIMRPGGYIEYLQERVEKVEVIKANKINIKKYNGKLNAQYMKTIT